MAVTHQNSQRDMKRALKQSDKGLHISPPSAAAAAAFDTVEAARRTSIVVSITSQHTSSLTDDTTTPFMLPPLEAQQNWPNQVLLSSERKKGSVLMIRGGFTYDNGEIDNI